MSIKEPISNIFDFDICCQGHDSETTFQKF